MDNRAQTPTLESTPASDAATSTDEAVGVHESQSTGLEASIARLEESILDGFAGVHEAFQEKIALDRFKEEQVTRLHEELQSYKMDLVARMKQPLLLGLVRLHDDLGKTLTALARLPAEEATPQRFLNALEGFGDDIELLLGQHGVECFEHPGNTFEPRRQTALRTEATDDPNLVGTVAHRLRPGFAQGETLLQKERVAVYVASGASRAAEA